MYYPIVVYQSSDWPHSMPKNWPHSMPKNSSESGIPTIKEVAKYLKVTERTIYQLATAKKIPALKVGGTWRYQATDIDG